MRAAAGLLFVSLLFSGCLSGDAPTDAVSGPLETTTPISPTQIDESFDLLTESVDHSWSWTMGENMTGQATIELTGNPNSRMGRESICYRLAWPQGHHQGGSFNCHGSGNLAISISPAPTLSTETVYEAHLVPNTFTLHVWAPNGPDTATLRVFVETHDA